MATSATNVTANRSTPWTLDNEAASIVGFGGLSIPEKVGFGVRIVGLGVLLVMATATALVMLGVFAAWQRRRRAFVDRGQLRSDGKDRTSAGGEVGGGDESSLSEVEGAVAAVDDRSLSEVDSTASTIDGREKAGRIAMELLGTLPPLPAYPPPSHPSGLVVLSLVLLGLVFRILLVCVSFAGTAAIQMRGLASPTSARAAYVAGVDARWGLVRAQAFFDYGTTTLFYLVMVAAARHLGPRLQGPRAVGLACDAVICLGGVTLWLAAWGVVLADARPDYERPARLWAAIGGGRRAADVHAALMVWTLIVTVYVCVVLVAKVVVSVRRQHSIRPISKVILATFSGVAVPTLLYQATIHIAWGITTRMEDWRLRPWEYRSQYMKLISIAATHPGEMVLLALAVWSVQKMHLPGRKTWSSVSFLREEVGIV